MKKLSKNAEDRLKLLFKATEVSMYKGKHSKKCECYECSRSKLNEIEARVKLAVQGGARIDNLEQTVPVRAHFRAQKNHLKNNPGLRELVREMVKEVLDAQKRSTN